MRYVSTRDNALNMTAAQAIATGLSRDGGLFTPDTFPAVSMGEIELLCKADYRERAVKIMKLFLEEFTEEEIRGFAAAAYSDNYDTPDSAPLRKLDDTTAFLELWHGPTCAFKDMALQMLPHLLSASLKKSGENREVCILVATSGDTGKAALEGFKDVDGTSILVFYPEDGVSDVQKLQMTTQEGANVGVCAVKGNFDDAQSGVKAIFSDEQLREELNERGYFLSSANSINWGRLLPQVVYYFSAYCDMVNNGLVKLGDKVNFCVPTGNFGNILAGYYAMKMGLPVNRLVCASNANNVLTDFIKTGTYDKNRQFHTTVSPSMDILISSNLERLLFDLSGMDDAQIRSWMAMLSSEGKYTVPDEVKAKLDAVFSGGFCDDDTTRKVIGELYNEQNYLIDTHTAVAYKVLCDYRAENGDNTPAVVVSTASPYKFCDAVLEAIGETADVPGLELVDKLSAVTGTAVPKPLETLRSKTRRFTESVEKTAMKEVVTSFLN
ncbi:MAG: threonine synthase [Oscillospiraceae bacterium]|nr:threonine synthase [Oscillospiraceae bacterium]